MDTENMTMEEKCEHVMNIVVESRKKFGKMCIEYEKKTSLIENKSLNLQLETIASHRFKTKNQVPNIDVEGMVKDIDDFYQDIMKMQSRVDSLRKNVKDTQSIVLQLKADEVGKKLKEPLTAEALLNAAKNKTND